MTYPTTIFVDSAWAEHRDLLAFSSPILVNRKSCQSRKASYWRWRGVAGSAKNCRNSRDH